MKQFKHFFLVLLCTLIALWLSHPAFIRRSISINADIEAEKAFTAQVFYTKKAGDKFNEKQSVKKEVKAGKSFIKIALPTKRLYKFRFDFGVKPGKVTIKNLILTGKKSIPLDFNDFSWNQTNDRDISKSSVTISSDKSDPYMVYKPALSVKGAKNIDWCLFLILLCAYWFIFSKGFGYLAKFKVFEKHSRIDIVFLSAFFILLFIPMLHISNAKKSEQENRLLATKPHLFSKGALNNEFGSKFNNWFNDHFWGRTTFTHLWGYTKYLIAPMSGNEKVLVGKNGWLFYKSNDSIRNFAQVKKLPQEDMERALKYLQAVQDFCKKNGKEFYYFIAPDKSQIYGENYRLINKIQSGLPSIGHQFANYIRQNSDIKVIYPYAELIKNKDKGLLYYKHDTHWTPMGAFIGYQELIKALNYPMHTYEFKITQPARHDLGKMLSFAPEDQTLYGKHNINARAFCNKPFSEKSINCKNIKGTDGRIFMMKDSFSKDLAPYLINQFSELTLETLPLTIQHLNFIKNNVDIVIFENVERFIPKLFQQTFPKE